MERQYDPKRPRCPTVDTTIKALSPTRQFFTDPKTGKSHHWCYGSLSPEQLEHFVPQCDQLCSVCKELSELIRARFPGGQVILWASLQPDLRYTHHGSLDNLRLSARACCHMCSQLVQLTFSPRFEQSERYSILVSFSGLKVELSLSDGQEEFHFLYQTLQPGYNKDLPVTLAIPDTGSLQVLSLARQWLHDCVRDHDDCRLAKAETLPLESLPTRLIEIVRSAGIVSARLVETSALLGAVKYLALSHCWGGHDIIHLKETRLDEFRGGMPIEELLKTFIEALRVTMYLGFHYLWIDSLCIIQDLDEDWQKECRKMHDIYQHSQCTIAALKAGDSHRGLFSQLSERRSAPCQLLGTDAKNPPVHAITTNYGHHDHKPLHKRGWVVQERCLSPRTLNFGDDGVSWICVSSIASEAHPTFAYVKRNISSDFLRDKFQSVLSKSETCFQHCLEHWRHDWQGIIKEYTGCGLTRATDRLPAISGLIKRIEDAKRVKILHGLLEPHLSTEVLWYTQNVSSRIEDGEPTWTWLSIEGSIEYGLSTYNRGHSATLSGIVSGTSVDTTFSEQLSESRQTQTLQIIGELKAVRSEQSTIHASPQNDRLAGRTSPNKHKLSTWSCEKDDQVKWFGEWYPDVPPDASWELHAVQIAFDDYRTPWSNYTYLRTDDYDLASFGLVVVRDAGRENTYQRVGYYELFAHRDSNRETKAKDTAEPSKLNGQLRTMYNKQQQAPRDSQDDARGNVTALSYPPCAHEDIRSKYMNRRVYLDGKQYEGLFGTRTTIYLI